MIKQFFSSLIMGLALSHSCYAITKISLPGGEGNLSGIGYQTTKISLNGLNPNYFYDLACKVNDPGADKAPLIFRVDINGVFQYSGPYDGINFDKDKLATHQARISDLNEHYVLIYRIQPNTKSESNLVLTWLDSDNAADPLHFECWANYSIGLKS